MKNQIVEINGHARFEEKCNPAENDYCFFTLIDGRHRGEELADDNSQFKKTAVTMLEVVERASAKGDAVSLAWIDMDCYAEFMSFFNVRLHELPKFVAIQTKTEK